MPTSRRHSAAQCGIHSIPNMSAQPFFEAALAGTGCCDGYANCTMAVLNKEFTNFTTQSVWSLWSDLDNGGFNFPRTMMNTPIPGLANGTNGQISGGVAENASVGYGNYNGGFVSLGMHDWHGVTLQENFTYSKALGTGAYVQATSEYTPNDPFDLGKMYGVQYFNHKFIFNTFVVWQTPWYKGQHGLVGRMLGGWNFAPVIDAGSGAPLYCNTETDAQSFGSGDGANYFDNEQCVFTSKYTGGASTHSGVGGSTDPYGNQVGTATAGSGKLAINMFKNPAAVFDRRARPHPRYRQHQSGRWPYRGVAILERRYAGTENHPDCGTDELPVLERLYQSLQSQCLCEPDACLVCAGKLGRHYRPRQYRAQDAIWDSPELLNL